MASVDIAIDISFLGSLGGIGTYTAGLLHALASLDTPRRLVLFNNHLPADIPQYAAQQELFTARMPIFPSHWPQRQTQIRQRMFWTYSTLPRLIREYHPTVYHALDGVSLAPRCRFCHQVVTVHDLIPITHPAYCRWRDALAGSYLIRRVIRKASALICVSRYTAGQILERFPFAESKIEVIHSGVNREVFQPVADREALAERLREKYRLYSPQFILCVATLNPRRNLVRFLEAFHRYLLSSADSDLCLVIAGCRGWKDQPVFDWVKEKHRETKVHFLGGVGDEELRMFYQAAQGLANPSLLEGFGFPVLEAMACETPVLCSSTTALGEIAGDAAFLFDPLDIGSISASIHALRTDSLGWTALQKKGIQRVDQFSWGKTARSVLALYDRLLEQNQTADN